MDILTLPDPRNIMLTNDVWGFTKGVKSEIESDGWVRPTYTENLHKTKEGKEYLRGWYPHCTHIGRLFLIKKLGEPFIREIIDIPSGDDDTDSDDSNLLTYATPKKKARKQH